MRLEMVPISKIKFDSTYQRELDELRVSSIAKNLNAGAAKAVSLSEREDGSIYCYDGQHTVKAFLKAGHTHIPAVIVSGNQQKEAAWFLEIQKNTKRVFVRDAHKAGIVADDEISLRAQNILNKYGLEISSGGMSKNKTGAIGTIRNYVNKDVKTLVAAMDAIRDIWENEVEAWSNVIIRGMYEAASDGNINLVVKQARKKKVTPRRVLDVAAAMQSAKGSQGSGASHAKKAIYDLCGVNNG